MTDWSIHLLSSSYAIAVRSVSGRCAPCIGLRLCLQRILQEIYLRNPMHISLLFNVLKKCADSIPVVIVCCFRGSISVYLLLVPFLGGRSVWETRCKQAFSTPILAIKFVIGQISVKALCVRPAQNQQSIWCRCSTPQWQQWFLVRILHGPRECLLPKLLHSMRRKQLG